MCLNEKAVCITLPPLLLLWILPLFLEPVMLHVVTLRHGFLTAGSVQWCLKSRPRTNSIGMEIHFHFSNHVCDNLWIRSICKWEMFGIVFAKCFREQPQATEETEHCAPKHTYNDLECEAKFISLNPGILTMKPPNKIPSRS